MKHSTAENSIEMQQQQYTETMISGSAEASAQLTIAMLPVSKGGCKTKCVTAFLNMRS